MMPLSASWRPLHTPFISSGWASCWSCLHRFVWQTVGHPGRSLGCVRLCVSVCVCVGPAVGSIWPLNICGTELLPLILLIGLHYTHTCHTPGYRQAWDRWENGRPEKIQSREQNNSWGMWENNSDAKNNSDELTGRRRGQNDDKMSFSGI